MAFKMKGNPLKRSVLKNKGNAAHEAEFGEHDSKLTSREAHEKQITKEHNIEAEIDNPKGTTCMICGELFDEHNTKSGTYPHKFKPYKPKNK